MPEIVGLTSDGFYECLGADPPCSACGASAGMVAVNPRTGEPARPPKVICLGVDWSDWLERHKDRHFPAPYARWLSWQTTPLEDSSS